MKNTFLQTPRLAAAVSMAAFFLVSCKKESSQPVTEIAAANLVSKFSFENNYDDSKSGIMGTGSNTGFVTGIKGNAYQGASNGFVSFADAPTGFASVQSFTVSMWLKTQKHTGGMQGVFTLPNTATWFGNMLVMINENTSASDSMNMRIYFEKNVTPAIGWYGQYIDLYGEYRLPNMYGSWNHVVFTYDAATSKFAVYLNSQKIVLEEGMTDRFTDDPNDGGVPLGPVSFTNLSRFIIGGFQHHLGTPWDAPEPDMLNYSGALDELRIYNKALTLTEVKSLYQFDGGK